MKKDFIVRQATAADHSPVYSLIKTAFETAEHRDGDEQDYAEGLRKGATYIPQLDLVAETDGKLMGHILFTKTYVTLPDGSRYDTLMVAPLSVLPEYRKQGVGIGLMQEGIRIAASLGYGATFLLGDPKYYHKFGYKLTHEFGITHENFPAEYLMVKEVIPGALSGITGLIRM